MNFKIIERAVVDFDEIYDDFVEDYIFSSELRNDEIRVKYGLTHGEFKELSDMVKLEYNISRRGSNVGNGKYYYPVRHGFVILKTVNCVQQYIGFVSREDVAQYLVELCKKVSWDIDVCRDIVRNYNECIV